jgi:hypothetical protein
MNFLSKMRIEEGRLLVKLTSRLMVGISCQQHRPRTQTLLFPGETQKLNNNI